MRMIDRAVYSIQHVYNLVPQHDDIIKVHGVWLTPVTPAWTLSLSISCLSPSLLSNAYKLQPMCWVHCISQAKRLLVQLPRDAPWSKSSWCQIYEFPRQPAVKDRSDSMVVFEVVKSLRVCIWAASRWFGLKDGVPVRLLCPLLGLRVPGDGREDGGHLQSELWQLKEEKWWEKKLCRRRETTSRNRRVGREIRCKTQVINR